MTDSDKILVQVLDEQPPREGLVPPPESDVQEQALWKRKNTQAVEKLLDPATIGAGIRDITTKLKNALETDETTAQAGSFQIESFTVGLAINASGSVALVGSVGAEASIQVTFKRS